MLNVGNYGFNKAVALSVNQNKATAPKAREQKAVSFGTEDRKETKEDYSATNQSTRTCKKPWFSIGRFDFGGDYLISERIDTSPGKDPGQENPGLNSMGGTPL